MDHRTTPTNQNPGTGRPARPVRVLICDDEPRTRQGLKALMFSQSLASPEKITSRIEVTGESSNGQEAIQMIAETLPEVVLIDARMPLMDGFEATRQIKVRWPEIRVIMLTMYPNQQEAAQMAGVDQFLMKGCSAEILLAAILNCEHQD